MGDCIALARNNRRVCILVYHRILEQYDPLLDSEPDVETFTWQMETLAKCFNILTLQDAVSAIKNGSLPPRAVCISFDDGYRSTHDLAMPVLQGLGLPATVFVTSGYLNGGIMWNDRILESVRWLPEGTLDMQSVNIGLHTLTRPQDKLALANHINEACKYLSPKQRSDVIEELEKQSGHASTQNLMLTPAMVANLVQNGFDIGGHTVNHPILTRLPDETARDEIVQNKRMLEAITGKPLKLFAYPNGKVGMDFDHRHVQMVESAGYVAAFTTASGAAGPANQFFELPRSRPWDSTPLRFSMRLLSWLAL